VARQQILTQSIFWQILFYSWTASEILIAVLTRTPRGGSGKVQDRGSMLILWIVILASITACEWIGAANPPNMFGGAHWLKTAALIVIAVGLAIRWTAVISLGKAFSANVAIRESQTVNTSGLYGWVRHPSYLGLLLVFLAVGLHARHWLAFAFALIPTTAALLYRIHVEEAALNLAFGDEYAAYSKRTKRLIPFVC
jgi:protein-S-isoprenylcysteine O-methyltransferase Ste14